MVEEVLRSTAHHEAGHAVVSWVVGLEMEGVSIEPQGSSLGQVSHTDLEQMEMYDEILRRHLVSCYAGVKAVELYTGRATDPDDPNTDPRVEGSDWDAIVELTMTLAGPEQSARVAMQEQAEEEARRVLRENWHAVEVVAQALLKDRSLDSDDISRILREANCSPGEPVYDYELDRLADRSWELALRQNALTAEGRHEEAQRVAEELAQVRSKQNDLSRLAESQNE
jgi:hypothetical protein